MKGNLVAFILLAIVPVVYGTKRCIDMISGKESDLVMAERMIFKTVGDIMDKNDFADIYRDGFFL